MKTVDSGGLPCKCGSPLVPCRCEREKRRGPRGFNSTLRQNPEKRLTSTTRLKTRTLAERARVDPTRYGPVFLQVRRLPCFGRIYLLDHVCAPGYAPATAHHLGRTDIDGQVPVCGWLHDEAEIHPERLAKALRRAESPDVGAIGKVYVLGAINYLIDLDELPQEVRTAAIARGLIKTTRENAENV